MLINHHDYDRFQLWEAKVADFNMHELLRIQTFFSQTEKYHFENLTNSNKKSEFLLSRVLIRHALSALFKKPMQFWKVDYTRNSSPTIQNLPFPIFISLSHSHGCINVVTSTAPIGIDIEKCKVRKNMSLSSKMFMSKNELQIFQLLDEPDKEQFFYQIWCAKEAYFKSLSCTLQNQYKATSLSINDLTQDHCAYSLFDLSNALFSRIVMIASNNTMSFSK